MIFEKEIYKKIKRDYFFVTGKLNIDSQYYINEIERGIKLPDNLSFKTNISGGMTDWKFFMEDNNFKKIIVNFLNYIDKNFETIEGFQLEDAWGFKMGFGGRTKNHNHSHFVFSGVIYLNSHNQLLEFDEIGEYVKPEPGRFTLFSSFLKHGCQHNPTNDIKYGISFNAGHRNFQKSKS
tara:strand:- start:315 stop:851 length:537 start_codon:yes stop_codon:yes gene_type:complete